MLLAIVVAVVILIAGVLGYAAMRPDTFRVQRSIDIQAPAEAVYALIEDFHRWPLWSPWEKKDPAMERSHSGAPRGTGAVYAWKGDKNVGEGRMEILESAPPTGVKIKLDFLKPFEAHNTSEFTLRPTGGTTNVIWAMHGPNLFIGKLMSLFVSMDAMIGKDFETGLANMKSAAEKPSAEKPSADANASAEKTGE